MPTPRPILLQGLLLGGALGLAGGGAQLAVLRHGALTAVQTAVLLGSFAALGAALCATVGVLVGRGRGRAAAAGGVATAAFLAALVPVNARDLPNVVLLVTDTTRADHLSVYGYGRPTTPFLEDLAARAVVFRNAVSQGSHTIVTTPSLLTSSYPSEHGLTSYEDVLSGRFSLVSETLREAGYRTFAFVTNPNLSPAHGFDQGFDAFVHTGWFERGRAARVNEGFLDWLDETGESRAPFFAFLFYTDPHSPYAAPGDYPARFDSRAEPLSTWDRSRPAPPPDAPELLSLVAQYDAEILYWDTELRRLFQELDARVGLDDVLFIYTSDHGEEFFEHGNWGHQRTLFEESIRVPLLISLPVPVRFPPLPRITGEVDAVVSSVDVVPTLLAWLRIPPDPLARGRSALDVVLGRDDGAERYAYLEEILDQYGPYDLRGIRTRDHKLVEILDYEGDRSGRELFLDLRADPGEQADLPASGAEASRHRDLLDRNRARMARIGPEPGRSVELTPEARAQLEELGYGSR